ncbi:MAG: glycerophosphodiester phosphodiesterase [Rhizobiaceae bacterium]|nr:glycerophosphodiester phosphodiesterase [Rhizobiaceae bacterium]
MNGLSWLTAQPIAHRGLHDMNHRVWENTLPAFQRAIEHGYAIECDVHLTSDDQLVVFHDDQLDRLTGDKGYIWQRTSAEMQAMRVGTTQDHVPSLAALLDLVDGRVPLVIEAKGIPGHDTGLVARVGEALASYRGPVALMSFDHWLVRDFTRDAPGIPCGLTAWGNEPHQVEAHFAMLAHGINFTSFSITHLPNPFVTFLRERLGMPAISWTIRTPDDVRASLAHADQMTFEGFLPEDSALVS